MFWITESIKNATANVRKVSENYLWRSSFLTKIQLAGLQTTTRVSSEGFFRDKIQIILFDIMQKKIRNAFQWLHLNIIVKWSQNDIELSLVITVFHEV